MRRVSATSRARGRGGSPVALFPFLAVLMCAMGGLALLLVVVNRQSRLQAVAAARAKAVPAGVSEDLQVEREAVQWRITQLQTSRQVTEAQLAEARLTLGHLEDHARRLRDEVLRMQAALADVGRLGAGDQGRKDADTELSRLKTELARAERQLVEARQTARSRPRSYVVIPYEGPNQTHRRPMYLECRADAIVLQPEGIVLTAGDFDGPLGPGNPLDAGLRAIREHLLRRGGVASDDSGEPYPLLLVRPNGIEAYYAARAALKSWGTEFGYELIGEEWKLQYQKPNPQLAIAVNEVVDTARVQQQRLVAAAPRHYGGGSRQTAKYRAAPFSGGIIRDGGSSDDERPGLRSRPTSGYVARRYEAGAGSGGGASAQAEGAATAGAESLNQNGGGQKPDPNDPRPAQGERSAPRPEGYVAGQPSREVESIPHPESAEAVGMTPRPGEWIERPPPQRPQEKQKPRPVRSLAETRGHGWGLPDAAHRSVGVARPIRIDCHQDRLVIAPETGSPGNRAIALGSRTEDSVDPFVSAVWEYMDSWGIAGKGMYWRPVLNVYVAPNGEFRYEELKSLLDGSGLEVKRKHEG